MKDAIKQSAVFGLIVLFLIMLNACGSDEVEEQENQDHDQREQHSSEKTAADTEDNPDEDTDEETSAEDNGSEDNDLPLVFEKLTFAVKYEGEFIGDFDIDLKNLADEHEYELIDDTKVEILQFYPDYYLDPETNEPASESDYPVNPLFIVEITGNDIETLAAIGTEKEVYADDDSPYEVKLMDYKAVPVEMEPDGD